MCDPHFDADEQVEKLEVAEKYMQTAVELRDAIKGKPPFEKIRIACERLPVCPGKNLDPEYCVTRWYEAQRKYIIRTQPVEQYKIGQADVVLEYLRQHDVQVVAVTANEQGQAEWLLSYVGLQRYFNKIIGYAKQCGDGTATSKAEMVRRYLAENGLWGVRRCFIGDGAPDMRAGRENGCYCVGIDHDNLIQAGAHVVVKTGAKYAETLIGLIQQRLMGHHGEVSPL